MGLEQLKRSLDEKMSSTSYRHAGVLKQNKKPLMERFRRRKINNYLEELKYLVLSALNKEVSLYSKMEKADILDMAVRYIKAIRTNPEVTTASCGQGREHSTTVARSYGATSPIPSQLHTKNIIHDNSCEKEQSSLKKNHSTSVEIDKLNVNVSSQENTTTSNERYDTAMKENITARNEENNNCLTSRISTTSDVSIWRPW